MKRVKITIFVFLLAFVFSCVKNQTDEGTSIYGKWEVTGFNSVESAAYSIIDGFYPVIEFNNDGSYNLKLDVNSCFGSIVLSENNRILISAAGCTKMCCDSEFSQKFVQILPRVESYQIENNNLKLDIPDWGWINLKLYN